MQTSGSTGCPKALSVEKEKMIYSARQTCSFLDLQKGDTALLCMPLQYIGAKMMVVRALVQELQLIVRKASGHPLKDVDTPLDFAAMTPQQVYNSLQIPEEKERLGRIKKLIIGGGMIDPALEKALQSFTNEIYATYGMTETLSHIAMRRLNGQEASSAYTPFPAVTLRLSNENTLIIEALQICDEPLETNDIAKIYLNGSFRILGRKDNTINTGGIKVQAEVLEEKLSTILSFPFAITSAPDPKFGEAIVLLIETDIINKETEQQIKELLPSYEYPKHIIAVKSIPLTPSGKIDRAACKEIAIA
ncbi:AMP-binding protein [Parabacteroides sp. PH5-8]|uniref:AMP-binding protein n=1 Tax=unclassified Parabacteroides TaxID=2649774 RepID=UPI0032AE9669